MLGRDFNSRGAVMHRGSIPPLWRFLKFKPGLASGSCFGSGTPYQIGKSKTTPVGFEPTRGDPIGLAGRRLNRSAKVSLAQMLDENISEVPHALESSQLGKINKQHAQICAQLRPG